MQNIGIYHENYLIKNTDINQIQSMYIKYNLKNDIQYNYFYFIRILKYSNYVS